MGSPSKDDCRTMGSTGSTCCATRDIEEFSVTKDNIFGIAIPQTTNLLLESMSGTQQQPGYRIVLSADVVIPGEGGTILSTLLGGVQMLRLKIFHFMIMRKLNDVLTTPVIITAQVASMYTHDGTSILHRDRRW